MITYTIITVTVLISFVCFNNRELFEKLALNPYRVIHRHEWYRIITHGFVHADTTHLFVNMFTYWSFGTYIENVFEATGWGTVNYLLLYFGAMVVASIPDFIKYRYAEWYRSIGASGAVSAILFTSIFLNPWDKILLFAALPVPGIVFGIIYLIYCQYMAKRGGDNINHNAHFFGAIYGFIFPLFMNPRLWEVFLSYF
ncbi:rhomboid family intramembrane serine protease [Odoribacter lunatus]|uniref:rhomboid family intramembrane serine protease n=1 Tax=Odoribacter lunatus TaxID=2941335 RepID=UPI00203B36A2|nr:rhomboid family intramembrane serine protease [Odoribacter lunatus]